MPGGSRNRVYVKKQDFDFVYRFLCERTKIEK